MAGRDPESWTDEELCAFIRPRSFENALETGGYGLAVALFVTVPVLGGILLFRAMGFSLVTVALALLLLVPAIVASGLLGMLVPLPLYSMSTMRARRHWEELRFRHGLGTIDRYIAQALAEPTREGTLFRILFRGTALPGSLGYWSRIDVEGDLAGDVTVRVAAKTRVALSRGDLEPPIDVEHREWLCSEEQSRKILEFLRSDGASRLRKVRPHVRDGFPCSVAILPGDRTEPWRGSCNLSDSASSEPTFVIASLIMDLIDPADSSSRALDQP